MSKCKQNRLKCPALLSGISDLQLVFPKTEIAVRTPNVVPLKTRSFNFPLVQKFKMTDFSKRTLLFRHRRFKPFEQIFRRNDLLDAPNSFV